MGRNIAIFDNDYNTTEEGRSWTASGSYSQAYGFASITMYSWWQSGEIGCAYRICNSLREAGRPLPLWRELQNFKFGTRIQSRLVATNCT